jgi:D-proline reductase (dithiol) PrdB
MTDGTFQDRIVRRLGVLFTWNRPLRELWARVARAGPAGGIPWAPLRKPLSGCTVALVTTAGVHIAGDTPFDMKDRRGDPTYREIPGRCRASELVVTHDYYDHRDADRDVNVVFPIDRLREMASDGEIGRVAPSHYGFMGHLLDPHMETLRERTAPEVARKLSGAGVDLVLLSPA